MLKTESVAGLIENKLNEVAQKDGYMFRIFTEVGNTEGGGYVEGILRCTKSNQSAVEDFGDYDYSFQCQVLAPCLRSNDQVLKIKGYIQKIIKQLNAKEIDIDNGKAIPTFSNVIVEQRANNYLASDSAPISFNIDVKYSTNVVTSKTKHWFLNDIEIPYTSEVVLLEKDGITKNISGEEYKKTQITGQTKFYKFSFPFDSNSDLCKMLQKDILNGDFEKTYTLKYFDGLSYTEEEPFVTTVSIFRNADTSAQLIKTSNFNVTFTDTDNGGGVAKYYLALCDTVFDMNSENTRYFEPTGGKTAKEVQIDYWLEKVAQGCDFEQIKAPNLNSIDITSQVYRNTRGYELFDLTNKNYAVIKIEQQGKPTKFYYYFVTNASIGAQNQVMFDLKLDTIQSYFFEPNIEFGDCLINRAHLSRFYETSSDTVAFDFRTTSPFFAPEAPNLSKALTRRDRVKLNFSSYSDINDWLYKNVACWVYVFIKKDFAYKTTGDSFTTNYDWFHINHRFQNASKFNYAYTCISYPIYRNYNSCLIIKNSRFGEIFLDSRAEEDFRAKNTGTTFYYSIKFSMVPPFSFEGLSSYNISGNTLTLTINDSDQKVNNEYLDKKYIIINNKSSVINVCNDGDKKLGIVCGADQPAYPYEASVKVCSNYFIFDKQTLIHLNPSMDYLYNPLLYNSQFKEFVLCDNAGGQFSYSPAFIGYHLCNLIYTEPIQSEITKLYFRVKTPVNQPNGMSNGIYIEGADSNYNGLVSSIDNSIAYATDKYDEFLANNKNFWLQSNLQLEQADVNATLNIGSNLASNFASGNFLGGIADGVMNGATAMVQSSYNRDYTRKQNNLMLDNMKASPASLKNANGNSIFNQCVTEFGLYIEERTANIQELKKFNETNLLFGYEYNRKGNIKDFVNIRKYFNYLEATITSIDGISLSNAARNDIRQRFQCGIRFWMGDSVNYQLNNYEKWLEY